MAKSDTNLARPFDWRARASYEYTVHIPDRGWAWEGLRRNREFQEDWHEVQSAFESKHPIGGLRVVRANDGASALDRWGVLYSDPPNIDARNAAIVWQSPRVQVLNAVALPEGMPRGFGSIRLLDVGCSTLVLLAPDGVQHVLFHGQRGSLQLHVTGADLLDPVHLLIDAVPDVGSVKSYLQAQALLAELRARGQEAFSANVQKLRAKRFSLVLQALDGFLADASLREIGVALFGAERIATDWDDDHRHLKDRVRRAVARGKWLMDGGYAKYLK